MVGFCEGNAKVKLSLLPLHFALKAYLQVEVKVHTFLISAPEILGMASFMPRRFATGNETPENRWVPEATCIFTDDNV